MYVRKKMGFAPADRISYFNLTITSEKSKYYRKVTTKKSHNTKEGLTFLHHTSVCFYVSEDFCCGLFFGALVKAPVEVKILWPEFVLVRTV